ncbi:MAG TPA: hypothetical protein VK559_07155 [Ferruginibacter sp.]|nr:hypothetical protein [Ferruginibacter sp.]
MSDFTYPSKKVRARKDYSCMACETISCAWNEADILALPIEEQQAWELAKANRFRILKGEIYVTQCGFYDGSGYVFRGIPAIVGICHKYDLWEE